MDTQYWPRLQKAEGVLPYIRIDIKGWVGDESDDNISAKTEIHSLEENNERDLMKVKNLRTRVTVRHLLIKKRQGILTAVEYFS